ncbi:septum site-determining protein Ssd [Gordonia sp. PKS22-38]|uniref:Septum site-determining protein Ssd n=1 Tax=Gordonia prachuapensis TaxID=3115651 RepID=A0ABU7MVU5_9ACTN|nr:septum site-determining protein Ssd [Gordonia sp. PKS22-38]
MTDELLSLVGPELHDDVARCAAAAGYRIVPASPTECRREWLRATAVAVDGDALTVLGETAPPRRSGIVMVTAGEPPPDTWRSAMTLGAEYVVSLPAEESDLVGFLTDFRVPQVGSSTAVALVGGHGGAGATTLAAAVALVAADRSRVLLLDVDDLGAGIDLTLGIEDRSGLRWQDLTVAGGTMRAQSLHDALPKVHDRLSVLAPRRDDVQPITADAVIATIDAGRADGDTVVIDLPRATGSVTEAVLDSVDLVVLVTTATVPAVASVRSVVTRVLPSAVPAGLAVRGPAPSGLRAAHIADAVGLPLVVAYRPDPGLPGRTDAGPLELSPRSPLARAARAVHQAVDPAQRSAT